MRLKSLWVDGFKNLNNFKIDFEKREGVTVLIGNNASGKSNVLEAISAIFSGLHSAKLDELKFKFDLVYEIHGADIGISKEQKIEYRIKKPNNTSWNVSNNFYELGYALSNDTTPSDLKGYQPSQIIALYSGEESRLWEEYYQKFYIDFFNSIRKQHKKIPELLYINKYAWVIGLITLICNENSKEFVKHTFGIDADNGVEIKFIIDNKKYEIFQNNDALKLIKRIAVEIQNSETGTINSKTLATFDIGNQQIKPKEIFEYLYITSSPTTQGKLKVNVEKIITDISLNINGIEIKNFSEGQKKQILLKLALDVLADENSLLLFDEPDAHIHIANKKLIPEMLKNENKEVVLTTHSPTLAHQFNNKHLAYIENGKINEDYNTQEELLNELTNGLMGISEQQLFLQSNKDILIVEGKTDEAYISQALKILKEDNLKYKDLEFNFLWLGGSDADTLNKIISGFTPKKGQTIIAFLDRDDAGKKCVKKALGKKTLENDFDGAKKEEVYIYLYPIKDNFSNEVFVVEDYFPIKILREYILNKGTTFQSITRKFDKQKFAKKCEEDSFDKTNFNGFKVLFNKILKIKNLSSSTR